MGCASSASAAVPVDHGFYKTYRLGEKLGEGCFGQVRVAKCKETQTASAVKIIDLRLRDDRGDVRAGVDKELLTFAREEISLWTRVGKDEHVVELFKPFVDGSLCYMVMEKCKCTLMDKFEHSASEVVLPDVFKQMLQGISHVHKMGVVHRDIKPDNFLYGDGNTLKLCDFGLAAALPKKGALKGVFGTAPYMSPEMLSMQNYDVLTDVWSFGACAYLMVFGRFPYKPEEYTVPYMKEAIIKDSPQIQFCSKATDPVYRASEFTKTLLNRTASERISAEAALELDFLKPITRAAQFFETLDPAPALRKARKLTNQTKEFQQRINPIVQKSIDELMQQLEADGKLESQGTRFFSEGQDEPEVGHVKTEPDDDRIINRSGLRKGTHSGVLSGTFSGMNLGEKLGESSMTDGSTIEGSDDSAGSSSGASSKEEPWRANVRKESKPCRTVL